MVNEDKEKRIVEGLKEKTTDKVEVTYPMMEEQIFFDDTQEDNGLIDTSILIK